MNIQQDFIPSTNSNRPGTPLVPTHITVHETANTSSGADAASHARYVKGLDAQKRQVSWHYTVDDRQIIQHLPSDEVGWHAGAVGNSRSIGIELCVNQDGDFNKTRAKALELLRFLASEWNIPVAQVVTHQHWTGKNCPANLLTEWPAFKQELVNGVENPLPPVAGQLLEVIVDRLWVYDRLAWEARYTTVSRGELFTIVAEHLVDGARMYELKSGLYITANPQYVKLQN